MPTLPIIDISPFTSTTERGTQAQMRTAEMLHQACSKYGFFYLRLDGYIDRPEPDELLDLGRTFFGLPQSEKDTIALKNEDGARGYARLKQNVTMGKADNHEGIDFYKPVDKPDKTKPLWGTNQWPEGVPHFRAKYEAWVERMKALGVHVMEAMAMGLGMTTDEWLGLKAQVSDSFWVMRVIGYPQLPNDHDGFSCGAHRDYGCLTFLYADPTPGALQVFLNDPTILEETDATSLILRPEQGDQEGAWINADPIPGCCVCNIGEMWEIWSNGLYRSTLHRVIHRGSSYRVSLPFFFEPNFDAHVKPLEAALRLQKLDPTKEEDQSRVKRSTIYGEFLVSKVAGNFETGEKY